MRQVWGDAACLRLSNNAFTNPNLDSHYMTYSSARREQRFFDVQTTNTIGSIGNIDMPMLERHAMHFDSFELNKMVKKMPRVAELKRHLPAATETVSGIGWDTRKDLTHLYASATLG